MNIKQAISLLEEITNKKVMLKENEQTYEFIREYKNSYKYRVDVKDFVYGSKHSREEKNTVQELIHNFQLSRKFEKVTHGGETFMNVNKDETVGYFEDYSRLGPYYCIMCFKNRKQAFTFKKILDTIRKK